MNILLAVTGSISAYKAFDLTRAYLREGHKVRVVTTKGAEKFVVPQVFRYLGAEATWNSDDDFLYPSQNVTPNEGSILHVELAKWADRLIIAPLSANSLERLARGQASDLLSSLFLAFPKTKPIVVYPAMNTQMLHHPLVQDHLQKLRLLPNLLIHPSAEGQLACGTEGEGKLPDVEKIAASSLAFNPYCSGKKILISTGATVSPLDPVRYMTNSSSGMTGYEIAKAALSLGHQVTVVAGIYSTKQLELLNQLPQFKLYRVSTPSDMHQKINELFPACDSYISSAAIGDFEFKPKNEKVKKSVVGSSLEIVAGPDVLQSILPNKTKRQKIVGFAAETSLTAEALKEKWSRKPVDLLVGTEVHNGLVENQVIKGFDVPIANYSLLKSDGTILNQQLSKKDLAKVILQTIDLDGPRA